MPMPMPMDVTSRPLPKTTGPKPRRPHPGARGYKAGATTGRTATATRTRTHTHTLTPRSASTTSKFSSGWGIDRIMAPAPVEFVGAREAGGVGGDALYCAIILWLSVMSWIIFTCVGGDDGGRRGRKGRRDTKVFVGAERLCDGTGPRCSGGYGLCGSCVD
ncbi:uncharacterized protein LOC123395772 [Hordeum vulgare subsp. vulgare]|uniref:Uncharacterized protein n=2 Tax=Hordeum vulgare subsp. vulgare TaxID=112509 RepID=A0A8I6YT31_HORVV|nr:uncharacterized protein LOC123395772 [Hordeum vulgare subsp. vulgare]